MTRDSEVELLLLDNYVHGLDAADDDIGRVLEMDLIDEGATPMQVDEFTDDEIDAHVEMALVA